MNPLNKLLQLVLRVKLVRSGESYKIELVEKEEGLEKLYRFRYKIYCETDKLLDKNEYPEKKERDELDDKSVHFAAFSPKGDVVGTVRLIKDSKLGFPTEEEFNLGKELEDYPRKDMVEVSRFMIDPEYRGSLLFLDLCKTIYLYAKKEKISYFLGCGEDWFVDIVSKIFGKIDILGGPKFCFNAMNYPFLIDIKKASSKIKRKNKLLFFYFNTGSNKIEV